MITYNINCNNCDYEWTEESKVTLSYEDCTCPICGTYENLHVEEQA